MVEDFKSVFDIRCQSNTLQNMLFGSIHAATHYTGEARMHETARLRHIQFFTDGIQLPYMTCNKDDEQATVPAHNTPIRTDKASLAASTSLCSH